MFAKPFHVKSQTVLKGSDRKRIRATILSQSPSFTNEILNEIIPQKADVQQAKVLLHNGDSAVLLLTAKQPVFFLLGSTYYPTVYTLWNYPESLNIFFTWQPVISKLYGGADLMLPGVVIKGELTPDTLAHVRAGSAVAVAAVGNRAALAVGETCMSGDSMYKAGMKGKGVLVRHFFGDQLWALGSKVSPPQINELLPATSSPDTLADAAENIHIDSIGAAENTAAVMESADTTALESKPLEEMPSEEPARATDVAGDFERLDENAKLYKCFLFALKKKVKVPQLPMLTSAFFRDCIQACCPPGTSIDIKKTSYKKLLPFLLEMKKEGLLDVKETAKGVHSVTEINVSHNEVQEFRPWKLPLVEEAKPDSSQEYVYSPPEIIELLAVNAQTLPLFSRLGMSKGDTLSQSEMRALITGYVKEKALLHPENKQLVTLDEVLTTAVVTKKDGFVEYLKWNILFERLTNALGTVYRVSYPNGYSEVKKGKPPPINVVVETRTGNKKVTLINNLDKFGIEAKEVAKELRSGKACNTSIQESQAGVQLLAQGNHSSFIYKLLKEKYKIPIKFMKIPT
ncbi:eukaryotic translation initiation factor 2D-like [Watersipora subatra]|uniref:eukaryotic translation initiation factor 2D-like n=1 Tax=Watersipora subatra TaxID=2589382 RepID=UPI00355B74B9